MERALKVDMQKAYDWVEWEFLIKSFERRGFGEKWIVWIQACITIPTYRVLVNGNWMTRIRPTRGIRQGDPLSPYMFIFLRDILSRQIGQDISDRKLKGIILRKGCPELHHLFFANILYSGICGECSGLKDFNHGLLQSSGAAGQCVNIYLNVQ